MAIPTVLLSEYRMSLYHVDSTRITTVQYMSVPVIMIAALPAILAAQPLIPMLEMERQMVNPLYGRPKNLFKWFYLMGLTDVAKWD